MEYLETGVFIKEKENIPVVDVRSPAEFSTGHISGALNIPMFSDEERAKVGTEYKQKGRMKAIETGLDIVGPKMKKLTISARSVAERNELKVYCWRGGMRSEKMSWLFELAGITCYVLKGGFKAYRQKLLDDFGSIGRLVVLQGPTGTGKSAILRKLKEMGEQIIDLEALANHRGSAFGHIGLGSQPTSMQFQNDIHHELMKMDLEKRIWVESESLTIGKVYLPEPLWEKMNTSTVIELKIPDEIRIERIVREYSPFGKELLSEATRKIRKRFGGNNVKQVLADLERDDFYKAASLLLSYYDKSYSFSQNKYKNKPPQAVLSSVGDVNRNAELVLEKAKELDNE